MNIKKTFFLFVAALALTGQLFAQTTTHVNNHNCGSDSHTDHDSDYFGNRDHGQHVERSALFVD